METDKDGLTALPIPPWPWWPTPAISSDHPILIKHNPANRTGISEMILPNLDLFPFTVLMGNKVCSTPRPCDILFCHPWPDIGGMTNMTRSQNKCQRHEQQDKNNSLSHNNLSLSVVLKLIYEPTTLATKAS